MKIQNPKIKEVQNKMAAMMKGTSNMVENKKYVKEQKVEKINENSKSKNKKHLKS